MEFRASVSVSGSVSSRCLGMSPRSPPPRKNFRGGRTRAHPRTAAGYRAYLRLRFRFRR